MIEISEMFSIIGITSFFIGLIWFLIIDSKKKKLENTQT